MFPPSTCYNSLHCALIRLYFAALFRDDWFQSGAMCLAAWQGNSRPRQALGSKRNQERWRQKPLSMHLLDLAFLNQNRNSKDVLCRQKKNTSELRLRFCFSHQCLCSSPIWTNREWAVIPDIALVLVNLNGMVGLRDIRWHSSPLWVAFIASMTYWF